MKKSKNKKTEIKFIFDNEKAAELFLGWLSNSGEQQYWEAMECVEDGEKGNVTVVDFDYWGGTKKGSKFGESDIICKCGRLTEDLEDD